MNPMLLWFQPNRGARTWPSEQIFENAKLALSLESSNSDNLCSFAKPFGPQPFAQGKRPLSIVVAAARTPTVKQHPKSVLSKYTSKEKRVMESEGFTYRNKKCPFTLPVKPTFALGYSSYKPFSTPAHVGSQVSSSPARNIKVVMDKNDVQKHKPNVED